MKQSICPQCRKEFSYYPSMPKKYCSRKCQSDASRVVTNCPECGKEFWYHRSWKRKYCSMKCRAANTHGNLGVHAGNESVYVECETCGNKFKKLFNQVKSTKHNFCSSKCFGVYVSKTRKGVSRPEVSGEKPHLQKRVNITCYQCGKVFKTKQSHKERRKFCSRKCMIVWQTESGYSSGENNLRWKGGRIRYYGPNWHQQQRNARARDKYTCQRCGVTEIELGCNLDVHHKKSFRKFGIKRYKEANTLENLISFCKVCHTTVEHNGL